MNEYSNWGNFRAKAIEKAIDDGYFDNANDARKYTLECDGTWRLNADQQQWFKVDVNFCQ